MKVVTAKEMRQLDQETIRAGIPGRILMERAGTGAFQEIQAFIANVSSRHVKRIIVLTGKGNNGGDGYVIARLLAENTNFDVSIHSVCSVECLKGDAFTNAVRLPDRVRVKEVNEISTNAFEEGTIVIDCLLGTGISGSVKKPYATMIQQINDSGLPVISIDVPSGINADNGNVENVAIHADLTITIGLPKIGLFTGEGMEYSGQLRLVEIGIPEERIEEINSPFSAVFRQDVRGFYKRLPKNIHKARLGKVLIVGGSEKFPGAPLLAGYGALRAGGGLVTVAYPRSIAPIIHSKENALILQPVDDQGLGYHKTQEPEVATNLISDKDVVVVGPGLARKVESMELVRQLLLTEKPLVVDADGLYVFTHHQSILPRKKGVTILTPHAGEMKRLITALDQDQLLSTDRITQAKTIAMKLGTFVVLKGPATVVASPRGTVSINASGSPALATGGTGDVLAGMIATYICQFQDTMSALTSAVFIHGYAAELAARGMRNFVADDLLTNIGVALKDVTPFA